MPRTTRLEHTHFWPAMMTRTMAADYCSLSVAQFEWEFIDGRLSGRVLLTIDQGVATSDG